MAKQKNGLMLEYFVPIQSSASLDGDFTINGIAINETTTSNGHNFIGEELKKSAHTLIGVPLLKDHDNRIDSIVGKVNGAHWDEALRNIPFKAIVKDAKVKQLIRDGLLDTVSVGAHVSPEDIEEMEDGSIVPHNITFKELSVVAVPADGGATFSVALNNAYKSYSTKLKEVENSTKTERGDNMTEEEKKTETETTETEVETKEVPEVSEEEKALDEKIEALRIAAKKKELAVLEADADEKEAEVPVEKEEKKETKEVKEEEEEEEETVEEKGDYTFTQGHKSMGIQRKSYVYR